MIRAGRRRTFLAAWLIGLTAAVVSAAAAQAPDGDRILRGAGVDVPRRGGAETAFDRWMTGPAPVPPGAFAELIVGMGPVGTTARIRAAYAFGVLAGRSGRTVPPGPMAGAGVALLQMIHAEDRRVRVAGARVAGRLFAAPIDGGPPPIRPAGLEVSLVLLLNESREDERMAAMEALGLLGESATVPAILEQYRKGRADNRHALAGAALEALARIGDRSVEPVARELAADAWSRRDDAAGLAAAYVQARLLEDASADRLRAVAAENDERLGPLARAYLAELGTPVPD